MAHVVETFKGVEIRLNDKARFEAMVQGKRVEGGSIDLVRSKIKASGIGEASGKLEGLSTPVYGAVNYGFREGESLIIRGVTSETEGVGRNRKTYPVYVVEVTEESYSHRKGDVVKRQASRLSRPNPAALAKLKALHTEYVAMTKALDEQARKILQEEFEYFEIEDVMRMLEGAPENDSNL
jgi:hypothetical protein